MKTLFSNSSIALFLTLIFLLWGCGTKFADRKEQTSQQEIHSNNNPQADNGEPQNQKTMEKIINDSNFQEIISESPLCVIDFSATWCGPCKRIAPIISELAAEYDGRITICKCDVDESEELASKYGVRNIPFVVFLKNGEKVDQVVGAAAKGVYVEKLEALLK